MRRSKLRASTESLERWRALPARATLTALCDYAKPDSTFRPTKAVTTERWHARVGSREFELLIEGTKFFDTRTRHDGGGAVDLAMHLLAADFKHAVQALTAASL